MPFNPQPGDYNSQLAAMIAQSRPKQAGAPSRVGMLAGGGARGGGMSDASSASSTTSDTTIGVNAGGIVKALKEFGYESPSDKKNIAKQMWEVVNKMTPEQRESYYRDPRAQEQIESQAKSPYVMQSKDRNRYEYVPMDPNVVAAATQGQVGGPAIAGGLMGETAAKRYAQTQREAHPQSEAQIIESADPGALARTNQAKIREAEANTLLLGAKTAAVPADAEYHRAAAEAQRKQGEYYAAQADAAANALPKAQSDWTKTELGSQRTMEAKLVGDIFSEKDKGARQGRMKEVASHALGHIERIKAINDGDPTLGLGAAATYINMTGQEIGRMEAKSGFLGGAPILDPQDEQSARVFLNDSMRLIQSTAGAAKNPKGSKMVVPIIFQALDNASQLASKINLTEDVGNILLKLVQVGKEVGYPTERIINPIKARMAKKGGPAPPPNPFAQ